MKLKVVLIFLFLFVESSTESCNATEEQFLNGTFIITGPCPSVIIAPVGETVSYKCNFIDNREGFDLFLWNISGLSGSPFLDGEESLQSGISISQNSIDNTGDTTLDIQVIEQNLMKTVNIQCGLCSLLSGHCNLMGDDRLQENIVSQPAILVAFSKL